MRLLQIIAAANMVKVDDELMPCSADLKRLAHCLSNSMSKGLNKDASLEQMRGSRHEVVIQSSKAALTFHNIVKAKVLAEEYEGSFMVHNNSNGHSNYAMVTFYRMEMVTGDTVKGSQDNAVSSKPDPVVGKVTVTGA